MIKSKDEKVQNFLDGIMLMDNKQYDSLIEIRKIIFNVYPETKEKIMYGGIVFFFYAEMFSGLFVNKNHITLEFSKGYVMGDPKGYLEGKGKYRRHLKIMNREDVLDKKVAYFIKQVMNKPVVS